MALEQAGNKLPCIAHFTKSKLGATSLSVTVNVWRYNGTSWTQVVTGGVATEIGQGAYYYDLAAAQVTVEGMYLFIFSTVDTTVDQREITAGWEVGKAGVEDLDASISSRATAGTVWDVPTASHTTPGSTGAALTASGGGGTFDANAVWDVPTTAIDQAGSIGQYMLTNLDVPVSSRIASGSSVTYLGPVASDGAISIVHGDDYLTSRALTFTGEGWPDLTGATVKLTAVSGTDVKLGPITGTVTAADSVTIELSHTQTATLLPGVVYAYDIQATLASGQIATLQRGKLSVLADFTP